VAYYLLAEAYLFLLPSDNEEKIEKAYESAIDLNPDFEPAYRELANFYFLSN
jgi:tetratricopeptide (TPR) repeat protein